MKMFSALTSISLVACVLVGCGDKSGGGSGSNSSKPSDNKSSAGSAKSAAPAGGNKVASCNVIKTEGLCREYGNDNIEAAGLDFIKNLCSGGEFKEAACPSEKKIGACVTKEGTKVFYNDGPAPMDAAAAEKACKEGVPAGEWKKAGG
ncbi:MAG: hypothetical protein U0271_37225 [Polyangiaceae bacterium]